jgi:hypothetical protein
MDGSVKPLELNTTFDSYDELKEYVAHYQRPNFVQLYKRDARTIEAMKKRAPSKNYQENLMYSCIKYCCIHGGKNHKPSSSGM